MKPIANIMNKHILMMAHDGQCHNRENNRCNGLEYIPTLNLARWLLTAFFAGGSSILSSISLLRLRAPTGCIRFGILGIVYNYES
jgi:hypothetical protein